MLLFLFVGLLTVSSVGAADNLTYDVVGIETNDEISDNGVEYTVTDVSESNNQNSSLNIDDTNSINQNDNNVISCSVENK